MRSALLDKKFMCRRSLCMPMQWSTLSWILANNSQEPVPMPCTLGDAPHHWSDVDHQSHTVKMPCTNQFMEKLVRLLSDSEGRWSRTSRWPPSTLRDAPHHWSNVDRQMLAASSLGKSGHLLQTRLRHPQDDGASSCCTTTSLRSTRWKMDTTFV